jgi:hypothetical protein
MKGELIMENEIMNYEEIELMDEGLEEARSGMSTGGAVLLGVGLAAAGVAVGKLIKWAVGKRKAHKELKQPDQDIEVSEEDLEKVTK